MIDRQRRDGVTLIRMNHEPANVLDREFADAIADGLTQAARDPDTRAIVLTGAGSVFSAGVDLFRVLEETDDYLTGFFRSLDRVFEAAATCPLPLVAAINGHAIAGGAVLAFACDFRVMAEGPAKIGLPELRVGVPFPGSALGVIRRAVPPRSLREVVLRGTTFASADALERGLVDELASPEDLLERAAALAAELGSLSKSAFATTKALLRGATADETRPLEAEVRRIWAAEDTRDRMRHYLEETLGKRERR